jgi:hypothetical protein
VAGVVVLEGLEGSLLERSRVSGKEVGVLVSGRVLFVGGSGVWRSGRKMKKRVETEQA